MTMKMPVLFIGHGSPMNIVLDNTFTRSLAALGKQPAETQSDHGRLRSLAHERHLRHLR